MSYLSKTGRDTRMETFIMLLIIGTPIIFFLAIALSMAQEKIYNHKRRQGKINSQKTTLPPRENSKPNVTLNPLKWGKYTLIINSAEKKFVDIYNFQTPNEAKEPTYLMLLANTLLFEEVRLNRLSPDNFGELLTGFSGDTTFHKLIKPVGDTFFDIDAFISLYNLYIDFRAREIRPIVSTMVTFQSLEGITVTKDEIKQLSESYNNNPMFGRSV